jgi:hypothetical protein
MFQPLCWVIIRRVIILVLVLELRLNSMTAQYNNNNNNNSLEVVFSAKADILQSDNTVMPND